jgi:putative ABC transport system substrate-binding protein
MAEPEQDSRGLRRRSVLAAGAALTTGTVVTARHAAAQRGERVRRIGWLGPHDVRPAFKESIRDLGWIEGRNLTYETRRADERSRELAPFLAKELVDAKVDIVVAVAPTAIRAAMQATREIPIVMAWWGGPDLVASGLIASYARPGGNTTGVDMLLSVLDAKRLDVLHRTVPRARKIAVLVHNQQIFEPQMPAVRDVARRAGLTLEIADTRDREIGYDEAFALMARTQCEALLVMSSPIFFRDRDLIIRRAGFARLPAIYAETMAVREGGLVAYGTIGAELDRQAARQVDKILRGERPGEQPVEQPSRYEMAINVASAKALGLDIPQALLLQADHVIGG